MGLRRIAIACLCAVSPGLLVASAATQEILENGGFEEGASAWSGAGISTNGCTARSGSKALAVSALLQQNVPEPMGAGDYTLTGWLMAGAGSPDVDIALIWLGDRGSSAGQSVVQVQPGDSYAPFELRAEKPHDAESARVRLAVSGDGTVCLDDISLQGPPRPTATPVPTETPTTRPQPTSSATPPPSASLTVTPTPTATLTPEPTSTAVPSPGFILVNGGFEDGVEGWRKYGGELRAVSQPRYSGVAAGELYSYTDSTKWAYQTLRIDDSLAYEFSGYVRAGPGVSRAYLRISWYESSDGSGRAISTIDSTSTAEAAGDFVFLTTGPVAPPPGARSARPRVMMTPLGAGAAAIHFDDLSFTLGLLSTATPQLTATSQPAAATDSTPTPESTAIILRRPATQAVTNDDDGSAPSATTSPSTAPLREVSVQRYQPATPMGERLEQPVQEPSEERAFPVLWIVAGGLVVLGLGGNYVHGKRRRG